MRDVVVDSSALVAILEGEPEAEACLLAIGQAEHRWMSAATSLEVSLVVARRRGALGLVAADALMARLAIEVVPFEPDQVAVARDAWLRFGKGRHPAGLNFGDCFSYALSRTTGAPLLCKGDDFPRTDLVLVPLGA